MQLLGLVDCQQKVNHFEADYSHLLFSSCFFGIKIFTFSVCDFTNLQWARFSVLLEPSPLIVVKHWVLHKYTDQLHRFLVVKVITENFSHRCWLDLSGRPSALKVLKVKFHQKFIKLQYINPEYVISISQPAFAAVYYS